MVVSNIPWNISVWSAIILVKLFCEVTWWNLHVWMDINAWMHFQYFLVNISWIQFWEQAPCKHQTETHCRVRIFIINQCGLKICKMLSSHLMQTWKQKQTFYLTNLQKTFHILSRNLNFLCHNLLCICKVMNRALRVEFVRPVLTRFWSRLHWTKTWVPSPPTYPPHRYYYR